MRRRDNGGDLCCQFRPQPLGQRRRIGDIRRVDKQKWRSPLLPLRQTRQPRLEQRGIIVGIVGADKAHQRPSGGNHRMHRQHGFLLFGGAQCRGGGKGRVDRTAVKDYPVDAPLLQAAVKRTLFLLLGKKRRMANLPTP